MRTINYVFWYVGSSFSVYPFNIVQSVESQSLSLIVTKRLMNLLGYNEWDSEYVNGGEDKLGYSNKKCVLYILILFIFRKSVNL